MAEEGVGEPLRFTAALSDGRSIFAVRHASAQAPPSLYWRAAECHAGPALSIVSEPLEPPATCKSVPHDRVLVVAPDPSVERNSVVVGEGTSVRVVLGGGGSFKHKKANQHRKTADITYR